MEPVSTSQKRIDDPVMVCCIGEPHSRMPQMHIWGCLPVRVGERLNGIQEVSGSIPLISTTKHRLLTEKSVFF